MTRPSYLADEVPKMAAELVALRARVASLEAALTAILRHHDALCVEHGLAPNCGAAKAARALAPRSERREGEPLCAKCGGTGIAPFTGRDVDYYAPASSRPCPSCGVTGAR